MSQYDRDHARPLTTLYDASMQLIHAVLALLVTITLSGCVSAPSRGAPSPQPIAHIVFIKLDDPSDSDEIFADSESMLSTIPSVSTYHAGAHLDTGRSTILSDYDLAIILGFESESDLAQYVAHEQHIEYVEKWKPRLRALRVYDVLDED